MAAALGAPLWGCSSPEVNEPAQEVDLLQEIRGCSRIYSGEYQVSKIIVHSDDKRVQGKLLGMNVNLGMPGSERVIAVPVKGVLKSYVDMSQVEPKDIIRRGDSIEVILPDPKIELTSTRITAKDIKEKVGLFRSNFTDADLTRIQRQGRDSLIADVPRLGLAGKARRSASRNVMALLTSLGYEPKKIKITFTTSEQDLYKPARLKDMMVIFN